MTPEEFLADFPMPAPSAARPVLVLVAGLPASGKSVFARALAARAGAVHLSSDAIRLKLTDGSPTYSGPESVALYGLIKTLANHLLTAGSAVVIDATSLYPDGRRLSLAAAPAGVLTALVWTTVDEATAAARLAARAAGRDSADHSQADAAVRARMVALAVPPTLDEADLVLTMEPVDFEATLDLVADFLARRTD